MNQTFEITNRSRKALLSFFDDYTLEQLNKIPEGFNNNLIWNIGHIIVVEQMLVYNLSGLPMLVSDEMVKKFKRGSKPDQNVSQSEVDEIRSLLFKTIDKTKADYENKHFKNYNEYTLTTGFTLKNVEDALCFNYYHEAVHTGVMMSIRKFL